MGFLEKEQRYRQAEERKQRVKETKDAKVELANALLKQKEDEDRSHGPEDNAKISQILDHFPKFDIREYLGLVEKHSGYKSSVCLYSRDNNLESADQELNDKLAQIGLKPGQEYGYYRFKTIHPKTMFCGEDIEPRNWFLFPAFEPREPGIGIQFYRFIRNTNEHSRGDYSYCTTITRNVFIRIISPLTVVVTGHGEEIPVNSIETFDDAIAHGFRHPHTARQESSRPRSSIVGNG